MEAYLQFTWQQGIGDGNISFIFNISLDIKTCMSVICAFDKQLQHFLQSVSSCYGKMSLLSNKLKTTYKKYCHTSVVNFILLSTFELAMDWNHSQVNSELNFYITDFENAYFILSKNWQSFPGTQKQLALKTTCYNYFQNCTVRIAFVLAATLLVRKNVFILTPVPDVFTASRPEPPSITGLSTDCSLA